MAMPNSKASATPSQFDNLEEYARNILGLVLEGGRAMSTLVARSDGNLSPYSASGEISEAVETISGIAGLWMNDPDKLVEVQGSLFLSYVDLWCGSMLRVAGKDASPVVEPETSDGRFKDPEWSSNPYFDFWKQAYLLTTSRMEDALHRTDGLDAHALQKAEFYLRQITSALSPSNFPMTNPEVVRETLATNAQNLVQGMRCFVGDLEKSGDLLKISQTDTNAFEVGRNLAVTAGKVVFQNDIFQLIQYAPTTDNVREVPLLVVPPWINKYYILDLTPAKSFVKFAVDQGFTVFVMSWVNPDERLAHKTFEDYLSEGLLTASDAVKRETGMAKINVLGYCIGGTLLGSALAYLAAREEQVFRSATFLTTQFDFSMAGELGLFTTEAHLASLDVLMAERGYLDGSRLANIFNMMRPKDLIWPYIVNNYLLGKKPFPFDVLYWNQDSTRMPASNHKFYLREFYNENKLAKGAMTLTGIKPGLNEVKQNVADLATTEDHIVYYLRRHRRESSAEDIGAACASVKLDMKKVKLPIYDLATKEDHIAPAKSVFIGSRLFGGPVEFVLAGSGHIAGVVNPPDKMKYQFWTAHEAAASTLEQWMALASEHPGSWWPHWTDWLAKHSGGWTNQRHPGVTLGVIEDAPGSYVKNKG
jgi:polyhydroxyalkanoate synthase